MSRLTTLGGDKIEAAGVLSASSQGTSISCGTNAKGSWAQLIASTAFDGDLLLIQVSGDTATFITASMLFDIGIGAAASEQVVVPDVLFATDQWCANGSATMLVPCKVPAGSRIAARGACTDAGTGLRITAHVINIGMGAYYPQGGKIVSYGSASADSGGTSVDPGATANTKGAYAQITASTSEDLRGVVLCMGNQNVSHTTTCNGLLDIAIGGAGSEVIVIPDFHYGVDTNAEMWLPIFSPLIPVCIPSGSRIAARAACSINTASIRLMDVVIMGVT